ncbi:MAG: suppressor of tub2 mutation [Phylliscum demangeonii]|nr:MAG: suppressor of tub2 mutation [Phylliscum demangeonii]
MTNASQAHVGEVLALLNGHEAPVEAKVKSLNELKAFIKHNTVPKASVWDLFEIVRVSLSSPHAAIVGTAYQMLQHLLKRVNIQYPRQLPVHLPRVIPTLLDRFGDQKTRHPGLASMCLAESWKACPQEVESLIRETGLLSKSARVRESSMDWIVKMHKDHGLQFRSFVPNLVSGLEDADGMVRDTAKSTVIELFRHAPAKALASLKEQLKDRKVRKSIVMELISQLSPAASFETESSTTASNTSHEDLPHLESAPSDRAPSDSRPPSMASMAQDHDPEIEPALVSSARELDDVFRDMLPLFEGRESEHNWSPRERSILKLRRIVKGNALKDYPTQFLAGIRSLQDGIIKVVNSLRTTVSSTACLLVQELAKTAGSALGPVVELLLATLIKLSANTKKISSHNANITVDTILASVPFRMALLQQISSACQEKNVLPRGYASGWLQTIITKQRPPRALLEHQGGLDCIEKCIQRGLADPNPGVRERMRKTYWIFAEGYPDRAESIMASLDANATKLLQKDPSNPNAAHAHPPDQVPAAPAAKPFSRKALANVSSRSNLKEAIAAKRREVAATKPPMPRPGSALAALPPPLKRSGLSTTAVASLSSAPMRPNRPAKRPELVRPATADPYAMRRAVRVPSAGMSPSSLARPLTKVDAPAPPPKSKAPSPTVPLAVRGRVRPAAPPTSTSRSSGGSSADADAGAPSGAKEDEEMTMVLPKMDRGRLVVQPPPTASTSADASKSTSKSTSRSSSRPTSPAGSIPVRARSRPGSAAGESPSRIPIPSHSRPSPTARRASSKGSRTSASRSRPASVEGMASRIPVPSRSRSASAESQRMAGEGAVRPTSSGQSSSRSRTTSSGSGSPGRLTGPARATASSVERLRQGRPPRPPRSSTTSGSGRVPRRVPSRPPGRPPSRPPTFTRGRTNGADAARTNPMADPIRSRIRSAPPPVEPSRPKATMSPRRVQSAPRMGPVMMVAKPMPAPATVTTGRLVPPAKLPPTRVLSVKGQASMAPTRTRQLPLPDMKLRTPTDARGLENVRPSAIEPAQTPSPPAPASAAALAGTHGAAPRAMERPADVRVAPEAALAADGAVDAGRGRVPLALVPAAASRTVPAPASASASPASPAPPSAANIARLTSGQMTAAQFLQSEDLVFLRDRLEMSEARFDQLALPLVGWMQHVDLARDGSPRAMLDALQVLDLLMDGRIEYSAGFCASLLTTVLRLRARFGDDEDVARLPLELEEMAMRVARHGPPNASIDAVLGLLLLGPGHGALALDASRFAQEVALDAMGEAASRRASRYLDGRVAEQLRHVLGRYLALPESSLRRSALKCSYKIHQNIKRSGERRARIYRPPPEQRVLAAFLAQHWE